MTQAILAGFLIGMGDIVLMTVTNQYVAALLFCVALQCVIYFNLPLFTGRIGEAPWTKYWASYLWALLFNVIGATLAIWLFTLLNPDSPKIVKAVTTTKFDESPYLVLFLCGVFCNVLIHLACKTKHTIIVILCVMTFILCGFRHSIADAPYAVLSCNLKYILGWLCVLLGNTVGAIVTEWMIRFYAASEDGTSTTSESNESNLAGFDDVLAMDNNNNVVENVADNVVEGEYKETTEGEDNG